MKPLSRSIGRLNPDSSVALSTTDTRTWWAIESERIGTTWHSLIELHFQICDRLRAQHVARSS
jgi:hypothetical protein